MKTINSFIYFLLMLEMGDKTPPVAGTQAQFREKYPELIYAARLRAAEERVAQSYPRLVRGMDAVAKLLHGESRDGTIRQIADLARA